MPSERTPLTSATPQRGVHCPAGPNDLRGPCPVINSLANHGYIPRDGRNVRASDIYSALTTIGLSAVLRAFVTYPVFNEYHGPHPQEKKMSFLQKVSTLLYDPWSMLSRFGVRRQNQVDDRGVKVLNLDELAAHGAVEHDISLSRRDYLQKQGNCKPQQDLIKELIECSSDGKSVTVEDLAAFRRKRIQQQMKDNPSVEYGESQNKIACGEIAFILAVFGNGDSIPCSYVHALFQEERLPVVEGWKKRWWWPVGLFELKKLGKKVRDLVGLTFPSDK